MVKHIKIESFDINLCKNIAYIHLKIQTLKA